MVSKAQAATYFQSLRLFNRPVRLYLCAEAFNGFTVDGGVYAVLFNLYLLRLGYSSPFIGAVNAAGLLAFGLGSLPAGLLGGRWGNQRMIVSGLSMMTLGCAVLPLAEFTPSTWQGSWLCAVYVFINLGLALHIANAAPFIMANTQPAERGYVFSIAAALWFLAGFAGNLVGGWLPVRLATTLGASLDQPAPYRSALALVTLFLLPAVLAMRAAPPIPVNRRPQQSGNRVALSFEPIGWLVCSRLLQVMGVGSVFLFLNVYLDEGLGVPLPVIGTLLAIGRLGAVFAALVAPLLVARWNNRRLVIGATAGIVLSLLPLVLVAHWGAAALSFIGIIALTAIRIPALVGYSMEVVAPEQRAAMSGASEMANGLGFALTGLGGGYMITTLGYRPFFLLSAVLTTVGTLIFWWFCRVRTPVACNKLPLHLMP